VYVAPIPICEQAPLMAWACGAQRSQTLTTVALAVVVGGAVGVAGGVAAVDGLGGVAAVDGLGGLAEADGGDVLDAVAGWSAGARAAGGYQPPGCAVRTAPTTGVPVGAGGRAVLIGAPGPTRLVASLAADRDRP
jgi:hypothetical protein